MNKLYLYDEYDLAIGGIPLGKTVKPQFYFGLTPSVDYSEVIDPLVIASYHKGKYPKRRADAVAYSDAMNARIISNKIDTLTEEQNEVVSAAIDGAFTATGLALMNGRWVSALREIEKVPISAYVSQELIDEISLYIQNYIDSNY